MKVAKLVEVSLMTRVIVDEDATEQTILEQARTQYIANMHHWGYLAENVVMLEDDEEVPFDPEHDKP